MLSILKSPSPIQHSVKSRWAVSIGISLFVFVFLAIFRPFELYEKSSMHPILASFCFALIALFYVSIMLFGSTKYFCERWENRWTIGHELFSSFIVLTCIGITNYTIMEFIVSPEVYHSYTTLEAFFQSMWMTYAVGFFPISIFFLITAGLTNYRQLESRSITHTAKEEDALAPAHSVVICGQGKESSIELSSNDFLFAKSAGNYVEFYSQDDDRIRKDLQRITLAKVNHLFMEHDFPALKTHRGYIINTNKVLSYEGNSQGYMVKFGNDLEKVPVSRKQIPDFERVMNT